MSVNASYRRVTAQGLTELQNDPRKLAEFFGNFDDIYEDIEEEDYDALESTYYEHMNQLTAQGQYLDIMNEHQALNFLLTGRADGGSPPLGSVIEGGTLFGDIDVGYWPPRFLAPNEVCEVAEALKEVTEDDIRTRFDPDAMNESQVYPASKIIRSWRQHDWDDLAERFQTVKSFFINAAQEGDAVLFWYH